MGQITNGVAKIEIGDVGAGGTMGTNLAVLGYTNVDSASLVEADPTTTDFMVEELDEPIYTRDVPGKKTLTFQVSDPDLDTFVTVFGGTITGSGANAQWEAPRIRQRKEVSIKITPLVGHVIEIPRAVLHGKFNGTLAKSALQMIDITADVLHPADENTPPLIVGNVVTEAGNTKSNQTITFGALGSKSKTTDSPITLAATASSGLPVHYQSTDLTKATVSGNVLTLLATGSVSIIAQQPGNSNYNAAPPVVNALTITS